MANFAASALVDAQLKLNDKFASPEMRIKSPNVLGAFLKNTDIAMPNVGDLRTNPNRSEKAYFFNRSKRSNGGARAYNHTGAISDSTEVSLSWTTYSDKFTTSLKRGENNIYKASEIMAHELENCFKNIYEAADAAALTYLGTNKTQVNVATANGVFDGTNDVFEIATSDIARFLQHGKSMLRQNYYGGMADVVLDPVLFLEAEHYLQQGAGNSTNTSYQRVGVNLWEAVTLSDANYAGGAGYFIPEGTIACIDWTPEKNRQGWGDFESYVGGYSTVVDPITGLTFAIHAYSQRSDTNSAGGDTQDVTIEWEVSVDLSFNNAPLTTSNETTIFEVGITDTPAS